MSFVEDDNSGAVIAFASGALIGAFAIALYLRSRRCRPRPVRQGDDDYSEYEGGDLFV